MAPRRARLHRTQPAAAASPATSAPPHLPGHVLTSLKSLQRLAVSLQSGPVSAERIDEALDHAETLLTYTFADDTDNALLDAFLAREGTVKALVGILASTFRTEIHGPPSDLVAKRWNLGAELADMVALLLTCSSTHADQLATLLLRTDALHACAQHMAAAAELLQPYASIAPAFYAAASSAAAGSVPSTSSSASSSSSPSAAASSASFAASSSAGTAVTGPFTGGPPSPALLSLASDTLCSAMRPLFGIADRARHGSPAVSAALVSALASSSVMEHAGRLVLLMVQAVAGAPAGDEERLTFVRGAARQYTEAYNKVERLRVSHNDTRDAGEDGKTQGTGRAQLQRVLAGRCARHAAVSLGLAVVASADGGPTYGLPPDATYTAFWAEPAAASDAQRLYKEQSVPVQTLAEAVDEELIGSKAASGGPPDLCGPPGVQASMRLLLRAGRVVILWVKDLGQSEQPAAALCGVIVHGLQRYCHRLRRVPYSAGWTSEAVADTWRLVGEAAEHVMPYMATYSQRYLGEDVRNLLAASLEPKSPGADQGSSCAAALPTPVSLPLPPAPALLAAALRGGALPLLERLLRRACVDPAGPESRALGGAAEGARLSDYPGKCLVRLLAYGDVRQAASLVATLGKVLRAKGCRRLGEGKLEVDVTLGGNIPGLEFAVLGTAGLLAAFRGSQLSGLLRSLATADAVRAGEGPAVGASDSSGGGGGASASSSSTGGGGSSSSSDGGGGGGSDAQNPIGGSGPTAQLGWMMAMGLPAWLPPLSRMLETCLMEAAKPANQSMNGVPNPTRSAAPADKLPLALLGYAAGVGALLELSYPAAPADGPEPGAGPAVDTSEAAAWARALLAEVAVGPVFWLAMKYLSRPADQRGGLEDGELRRAATMEVLSVAHAWLAAGCGVEPGITKLLAAARALQRSGQTIDDACRALAARVVAEAEARLEAAASGAGNGGEPAEASPAAAAGWEAVLPAFPGLPAAVVLPACAYPACASLAGDSEAGLKLQRCARCGLASYCCRECQTAHWRSGHKEACVAKGG
ncbi:hypothetical protein HYH03_003393 [Edaphochlamys debaryana]|uniref:phytol kinase n=1 Tax=Edaphochlamys debaryana TaxID=47281 RepID=A0A835Y985_9CHLO|nr:hypothetical protein HYH03_003393 [Edaphochlamys debaryana]|eukprot:KAG2498647.1 hypothetical protein HYH03_003393 [Edaphochlamys debaryana]